MAKQDLRADLKKLGVKADPSLTVPELKKLLKQAKKDAEEIKEETPEVESEEAPVEEKAADKDEAAPEKIDEQPEPRIEAPETELPGEAVEAEPLKEFEDKKPLTGKALRMKAKLAAEPKVRFYIPLGNGEKMGVTQSVVLNGYPMFIRKGEYVSLPESVCDVLEEKMKQKMRVANHPYKMGGDGSVKLETFGK